MEAPRLKGRLLVANPTMQDPNFDRTVVLVLEHNAEGALGVVLNRPSDAALTGALPAWGPLAADPAVVFVGGPVGPDSAIGLARAAAGGETDGWAPLFDGYGTVDLGRPPDEVEARVDALRVFAGYAGWGPGQLEGELAAGGWVVVDAAPDDPLCAEPDRLWESVLRRQGGTTAWLADCPPNPNAN